MAEFRIATPSRGLEWFRGGVRMLDRDPRGLLTVTLGLAVLNQIPALAGVFSPGWMALTVVLSLLGPTLAAGLLAAIDTADNGRPVRLAALFEGFRRPGVRGQLVQLGLLGMILGALAGLAVWRLMGKENIDILIRLMHQQTPDPTLAQTIAVPFLKALLAGLTILFVLLAGMFFAVPRVMFQGRAALPAFVESLSACTANVLPLTVYGLVFMAVAVAVGIALGILAAFLGLLGSVGLMVLRLIAMALGVIAMLVSSSANYLAWREIYGTASAANPEPPRSTVVV